MEESAPILDGARIDDTPAVVAILQVDGEVSACSGTLIAANVVLTARHCVAESFTEDGVVDCGRARFGEATTPASLLITTESTLPEEVTAYRRAQEIVVAPGDDMFCGGDMALVVLRQPIAAEIATPFDPAILPTVSPGDPYAAIGFGLAEPDEEETLGVRRVLDGLMVRCVGAQCESEQVTQREWVGDEGVCMGDSGGPALDSFDRVIGVASRGGSACEAPVYGLVPAFSEWLITETREATREAEVFTPAWADEGASVAEGDGGCAFGGSRSTSLGLGWLVVLALLVGGASRRKALARSMRRGGHGMTDALEPLGATKPRER